jgi:S-DNA-T family DNA segregation ATPase FtsK/SpoIIIE
MANKKANTKSKSERRTKGKSLGSQLFHFVRRPLVWRLILLAIIVVLLFWWWPTLTSWATTTASNIRDLLGWGLVLIVAALGILVGVVGWGKSASLIHHWNRWLGGIILTLAVWGIFAFARVGGSFGLGIISSRSFVGILRILGLVIIGIVMITPRASFRLGAKVASWLGERIKGLLTPRPTPQREAPSPPTPVTAKPQRTEPKGEEVAPAPTPALAPTQEGLRQVAQEVWKKYGESPALVTIDGWRLPPIDILDRSPEIEFSQADNVQRARLIEEALASYGVEAKVVQINAGPTVTQFGVEPGWDRKIKEIKGRDRDGNVEIRREEVSRTRVKVDRITSLANDLALALAAPSIRIEAPVPGKSVIGIEVPNATSTMVSLRGVIESNTFQKIEAKSNLALALGQGAGGEAVVGDLSKMPHLLIAGATGSGKTVCLNSTICCLLLHNTPNNVRFIMIDPKRVELTPFNSTPHLATPVIVDTDKALGTLRWLNHEMDRRYQKLATAGARNIDSYNKNKSGNEAMPYLVLVIDELADLMMAGFDEVEHILCRLAQLARATGIHLVVATQRPSVDVVTGLIKANFPTRISFAVTSQVDSRTILDSGGAEKLLGRGDMLYMPTEAAKPKRLQGCYVSDAETERLVYFWGNQRREEVTPLKVRDLIPPITASKREGYPRDPLLEAARQLANEHERISTSFLQRRLHIGYPRAARIMEQLEEEEVQEEPEEEGAEEV